MDMKNLLGYEKLTTLVVGASSGMGEATAQILIDLGAEVYALDVKQPAVPGVKYINVDLRKKESIDAAIAKLPAKIDRIFNTAGIGESENRIDTVLVNFMGHRRIIESLLPRMPNGTGAIAFVASLGGLAWTMNSQNCLEFLAVPDWEGQYAWLEARKDDPDIIGGPKQRIRDYNFSKELVLTYVKQRAYQLSERGIRINTTMPGVTQTPLLKGMTDEQGKNITSHIGRYAKASEQAWLLVFLNSNLAGYISGADIVVDYGFSGGIYTQQVDLSKTGWMPDV